MSNINIITNLKKYLIFKVIRTTNADLIYLHIKYSEK